MTRVIIDEILRSRLYNLSQPLELCDEAGHVLMPAIDPTLYVGLEPPINKEELARRNKQKHDIYDC